MPHPTVVILNPIRGAKRYCSLMQAARWVKIGMAFWSGAPGHRLMLTDKMRETMGWQLQDGRELDKQAGYDNEISGRNARIATLAEIIAVPIANASRVLGTGGKRAKR